VRDGITHFEWLQAKKARVVSAALKSGMSASALARLPKPIVPRPDKLPPVVLATRHHATNLAQSDISRRSARARRAGKDFCGKPKFDHTHLMAMVDVVARRFGQTAQQVCERRCNRSATVARHIAIALVLEITGATQMNLAGAMDLSPDTVLSSRRYAESAIRNYAGVADKYGAAKADILARWPQYRGAA